MPKNTKSQSPPASVTFSKDEAYQLVNEAIGEPDMFKLKVKIDALLNYIESIDKKHKPWVCKNFTSALLQYTGPYLISFPDSDTGHNFVITHPGHSPTVLMLLSIPVTGTPTSVIDGLKNFSARCGEFVEPIEPVITEQEIRETINAAQSSFGIMDIIAPPKHQLKILRFEYSHIERNAECAIPDKSPYCNAILLYHPRNLDGNYELGNRVFVFAHELGHALHLALTGDISVLPDGFHEFNESLGVSFPMPERNAEAFADVTALAILASGLPKYLPSGFKDKVVTKLFVRYLKKITDARKDKPYV